MLEAEVKEILQEYYDNKDQCGFEAFVVSKVSPKLKRMSLSEKQNDEGDNFRKLLKNMFFEMIYEKYLFEGVEYADGHQLADNQNKNLIFEQNDCFFPFNFLSDENEMDEFIADDLSESTGLIFCLRKGVDKIWLYQHLWSIMIPNKKKTNLMARILHFENQLIFSEQKDTLLTIAKKIDMIIINDCLITKNITLLEKSFGFKDYIYQSANNAVSSIVATELVENIEKLTDYIGRGKPKYAKKMMRIDSSSVLSLSKDQLLEIINTLSRWKGKFKINERTNQITLKTYSEVETLIDLFDERYTRSDVTGTEYDTVVKSIAK